jgi:hypothetical protein
MPLFGTLRTMALPDLLQWLAASRMSGTLQLEHEKVRKWISVENGLLVGCSSEHPAEKLGQFMLARGKLSEEQLRVALTAHERENKYLGLVLVEMGIISEEELVRHLEAQAEEIIYSMFDHQDAVFRFNQGESDPDVVFPICLQVEDVLLRGLKRVDEMRQIREVFNSPGIILRYTSKAPPQEVFENEMARKLYSAIDGERTIEEILLHVHGSEYIVTKFLFGLHSRGFIEIGGIRKHVPEPVPEPAPEAAPDVAPDTSPEHVPEEALEAAPETVLEPAPETAPPPDVAPTLDDGEAVALPASQEPTTIDAPAAEQPGRQREAAVATLEPQEPEPQSPAAEEAEAVPGGLELLEDSDAHNLERRLELASQLMSQAEYERALEMLDEIYQEYPGDESLRRLTSEAEAAFIEKAYRHYLPPAKIVHLRRSMEELEAERLSPTEFFLLSRVDGSWDLKSIVQVAPLREADALRTLKKMREKGMIELKDPE